MFPKKKYIGGYCLKKGGLGQFPDLRGTLAKKGLVFLRGGWYPNAHYVFNEKNAFLNLSFVRIHLSWIELIVERYLVESFFVLGIFVASVDPITAQKMKFSMKDFLSKYDQIRSFLRIWSYLLKTTLMENFIFYVMNVNKNLIKLFRKNIFFSYLPFIDNEAIRKLFFLNFGSTRYAFEYVSGFFNTFWNFFNLNFKIKTFLNFISKPFEINIYSFCDFLHSYMFFSTKVFHVIFVLF